MHNQEFSPSEFDDEDTGDEGQSTLYEKYVEKLSTTIEEQIFSSENDWLEKIKNEELYETLKKMSEERLEVISMLVNDEMNQTQIAMKLGVSVSAISQRIDTIKKYLKKFSSQP